METGKPELEEPFRVCMLPLGAYQVATFVNLPDAGSFDPYWKPPVYTVTFRSAEEGFTVREAMLRLDAPAMDKLITGLRAASHPTTDNMSSLQVLMASQEYGEFQR